MRVTQTKTVWIDMATIRKWLWQSADVGNHCPEDVERCRVQLDKDAKGQVVGLGLQWDEEVSDASDV